MSDGGGDAWDGRKNSDPGGEKRVAGSAPRTGDVAPYTKLRFVDQIDGRPTHPFTRISSGLGRVVVVMVDR